MSVGGNVKYEEVTSNQNDPIIADALEYLKEAVPGLKALYVFGSAARDPECAGDVDLAFLAVPTLTPTERFNLQLELNGWHSKPVDLIDLQTATPVLAFQVIESGRLLHSTDPVLVAHFEIRRLAEYCALNEERREILSDIRARGTVYA